MTNEEIKEAIDRVNNLVSNDDKKYNYTEWRKDEEALKLLITVAEEYISIREKEVSNYFVNDCNCDSCKKARGNQNGD